MLYSLLVSFLFINTAVARDFGWVDSLTVEAHSDLSRFSARLSTRFHIGDVEVHALLGKVSHHADAYMILRLHELSGRPIDDVYDHYQSQRGKGWGALAMSLGIKPGSREFHNLKQGHDLDGYSGGGKHGHDHHGKEHGKGNGKGKGKNKHK